MQVLSGGVELGAAWRGVDQVTGRDYPGMALSQPHVGRRMIGHPLGRAASQDGHAPFDL